jgi:hypothetical protein
MARALATHDRLISTVVVDHGGRLVKAKGEGDSTIGVFDRPASAVVAALELQRALAAEPWPLPAPLALDRDPCRERSRARGRLLGPDRARSPLRARDDPAKATPKIVDHRATATGCHLETNPSARR